MRCYGAFVHFDCAGHYWYFHGEWYKPKEGGLKRIGNSFEFKKRNDALGQSVTSLLSGVRDVVYELGDSAEAQRALLDLARENIDAIQADQPPTASEQARSCCDIVA